MAEPLHRFSLLSPLLCTISSGTMHQFNDILLWKGTGAGRDPQPGRVVG